MHQMHIKEHVHSTELKCITSVNSHFKKKNHQVNNKSLMMTQYNYSPYFIESLLLIDSHSIDSQFVCLTTYPPNIS